MAWREKRAEVEFLKEENGNVYPIELKLPDLKVGTSGFHREPFPPPPLSPPTRGGELKGCHSSPT